MKKILFLKYTSIILIFCTALFLPSVHAKAEGRKRMPSVSEGNHIFIEYTLKLEDGSVVDTNVGSAPLNFIHGKAQIVPGLEKELTGMKKGDTKHVVVKPEEGYGKIRDDAIREVPIERIAQGRCPNPGTNSYRKSHSTYCQGSERQDHRPGL